METIKPYTDLEQSRKLAEFLSTESADMYYMSGDEYDVWFGTGAYEEIADWYSDGTSKPADIPCWSLSALLGVLPNDTDIVKAEADTENEHYMCTVGIKDDIISTFANNPVDACYELILRLRELNLL